MSRHYRKPSDWVFANRAGKPRWQESILQRQIKPAAMRAGIGKIGWHTFRHSYSSLLRRVGDLKVQQELASALDYPEHDECLYAGDVGGQARS